MNEVVYYGGLCPSDRKKLEFRVSDEEGIVILFAVCIKCKKIYFLDVNEDGKEFILEDIEINYKDTLCLD